MVDWREGKEAAVSRSPGKQPNAAQGENEAAEAAHFELAATSAGRRKRRGTSAKKGRKRVTESDELRTSKIFELREKIASGEYEVDVEAVAKRMVDDL